MEQVLISSRTHKFANLAYSASQMSAILLFFFLPLSTAIATLLFFLTIALALCSGEFFKNAKLIFSQPLVWILCAFYMMFLLGVLHSSAPFSDQAAVLKRYSRYVLVLALIPSFFEERIRYFALQAFLCSAALTLICVFLKAANLITFFSAGDALTIFKDHIDTGFIFALAGYIAMVFSLKTEHGKMKYVYYIFAFLIALTVFYLGYSRSAYLVFIALAALFIYQQFNWRYVLVLVAAMPFMLASLYMISPVFKGEIVNMVNGYQQFRVLGGQSHLSAGERLTFYTNGINAVKQHWLIGDGTGSVNQQFSSRDHVFGRRVRNLHNEYLNITVQFGVLGLLVLLSLFYYVWRTSLRLPLYYNYLMQGALVATASGSLINSWLMDSMEGHFFALIVILCLASGLQKKQNITS